MLVGITLCDYNGETTSSNNLGCRAEGKWMSQNRNGKVGERMPDTEVVEKAKRRQYTAEYKLRILHEVDACCH